MGLSAIILSTGLRRSQLYFLSTSRVAMLNTDISSLLSVPLLPSQRVYPAGPWISVTPLVHGCPGQETIARIYTSDVDIMIK
jgi:hypothetical protein